MVTAIRATTRSAESVDGEKRGTGSSVDRARGEADVAEVGLASADREGTGVGVEPVATEASSDRTPMPLPTKGC